MFSLLLFPKCHPAMQPVPPKSWCWLLCFFIRSSHCRKSDAVVWQPHKLHRTQQGTRQLPLSSGLRCIQQTIEGHRVQLKLIGTWTQGWIFEMAQMKYCGVLEGPGFKLKPGCASTMWNFVNENESSPSPEYWNGDSFFSILASPCSSVVSV